MSFNKEDMGKQVDGIFSDLRKLDSLLHVVGIAVCDYQEKHFGAEGPEFSFLIDIARNHLDSVICKADDLEVYLRTGHATYDYYIAAKKNRSSEDEYIVPQFEHQGRPERMASGE